MASIYEVSFISYLPLYDGVVLESWEHYCFFKIVPPKRDALARCTLSAARQSPCKKISQSPIPSNRAVIDSGLNVVVNGGKTMSTPQVFLIQMSKQEIVTGRDSMRGGCLS